MGEGARGRAGSAIDGGARMRVRRAHDGDISAEQIETFLVTLAETCNVVRSARAAGFSSSWAYRLRRSDAEFRNSWAAAVREGYAKLELVLLERAMKGTVKPIFRRDGSERIIRQYSTPLAVALLKRHAATADEADYQPDADEFAEVRDRILARLERIKAREEQAAGEGAAENGRAVVEVKGIDRVAVICWALTRQAHWPSPRSASPSRQHPGRSAREAVRCGTLPPRGEGISA